MCGAASPASTHLVPAGQPPHLWNPSALGGKITPSRRTTPLGPMLPQGSGSRRNVQAAAGCRASLHHLILNQVVAAPARRGEGRGQISFLKPATSIGNGKISQAIHYPMKGGFSQLTFGSSVWGHSMDTGTLEPSTCWSHSHGSGPVAKFASPC